MIERCLACEGKNTNLTVSISGITDLLDELPINVEMDGTALSNDSYQIVSVQWSGRATYERVIVTIAIRR